MKLLISITLLFICFGNSFSQWIPDSTADALTQRGVELIYSLQFDNAKIEFQKVIKQNPDHPSGHFFLAMIEWWRIIVNPENTSNDNYFYSLLEKVIFLCDKKLESNTTDLTALFFKGGAIGFRGRLRVHREQWLYAANDGRLAIPIVHQAYNLEPTNTDVLLGMGIYNYYRDVIPEEYPIVKPFVILFPKGDKMLGVQQLKQAAEKARYANYEATYFLIQILFNYEKKYSQALPLALKLYIKFPNNPIFHRYVGRLYGSLGKWNEMKNIFLEVLDNNSKNYLGYNESAVREAQYYLGIYHFNVGNYDSALNHFYKCDEQSRSLDTDNQSGFMVMTNLKIGMIYDLQSKRDLALKQYNKVLKMTTYDGSREQAKQYIKKSYGSN
ncbi:MAG: hypothetical protein QME58_03500 [Bacteroidota bacterium]|nr:hypothetical protein [Bacteroidota bacterium]